MSPLPKNDLPLSSWASWVKEISTDEAHDKTNWPPNRKHAPYDWEAWPTNGAYCEPGGDERDAPESFEFNPPFAEARKKLDYSYHRHPAKARQVFQDTVMRHVVDAHEESVGGSMLSSSDDCSAGASTLTSRPWIVFSAGPMGAGKSFVLFNLARRELFPLDKFIKIDPDMIKNELPEMPGYLRYGTDPTMAASMVHRESTQMADILFEHALLTHKSILVDGSLRDVQYHQDLFKRIRREAPEYRIGIIHVTAEDEVIYQRAKERETKTGRGVPRTLLDESIEQVPKSIETLGPIADVCVTISNNDGTAMKVERTFVGGLAEAFRNDGYEDEARSWSRFKTFWNDNEDGSDSILPPTSTTHHISMEDSWTDPDAHEEATKSWGKAYPSSCMRCMLTCDGQCGICIHGRHMCACSECKIGCANKKTKAVCELEEEK